MTCVSPGDDGVSGDVIRDIDRQKEGGGMLLLDQNQSMLLTLSVPSTPWWGEKRALCANVPMRIYCRLL